MFARQIKKDVFNRNVLVWLLVVAITAALGIGMVEPNSPPVASANDDGQLQQNSSNEPVQSINFKKDISVRDAIQFLAAMYHKNIVPSVKVDGTLAVAQLYEVTFSEAMNAVLSNQFIAVTKGNFINVYTIEEYADMNDDKSRLTYEIFTLYYVNAAEVKALVELMVSETGQISTTTAAATDTEAGSGGDTLSMRDMITVYDYPERIAQIAKMIKEIDVSPPQIMIDVTILEATLSETTNFGINWEKVAGLTNSSFSFTANLENLTATAFTANIGNDKLTAAIRAQEGITDTTVLANPKIMALNKQAGYLNIGEERGYTASTTQGQTTTTSVDFLVSGTILKFRPFICDNGFIRMEINPELSTGSLQTDANSTLPLKSITTVKTNIMVKDGKTIVIGGLFKEDLTNNVTQVPIVGDLPIIGGLFKKTTDTNLRKELVILITPHIITRPEDTLANERTEDVDRIVHGSRKRISSISRSRIYEDKYAKAVKFYSQGEYEKALSELNWIIAFRPNVLEGIQLRDRILKEVDADATEREMLDAIDKDFSKKWRRR